MANFTRLRLPGFWVIGSVVDPEEFEALDAMRELVPNFGDGSTHAPTTVIIIGGQGLRMTGPTDIDGDLDQDAASTWSLNGIVNFLDNSLLDMKVSSTQVFRTGSLLQVLSGADVEIDGNATWGDDNWPLLTERPVERTKWRLASVTYTSGGGVGPADPAAWLQWDDFASVIPAVQTVSTSGGAGRRILVELLDLPPGATLNTVTIRSRGTAGDADVNLPTYTLQRWKGNSSNTMSSVTTDTHTGANWTADQVDTVVTCTSNSTIDGSYSYGVLIESPYGTTAAAVRLFSFIADLDASAIQL